MSTFLNLKSDVWDEKKSWQTFEKWEFWERFLDGVKILEIFKLFKFEVRSKFWFILRTSSLKIQPSYLKTLMWIRTHYLNSPFHNLKILMPLKFFDLLPKLSQTFYLSSQNFTLASQTLDFSRSRLRQFDFHRNQIAWRNKSRSWLYSFLVQLPVPRAL